MLTARSDSLAFVCFMLAVGRRGAAVWPLDVARLASERAPRGLSSQERTPLELDEM